MPHPAFASDSGKVPFGEYVIQHLLAQSVVQFVRKRDIDPVNASQIIGRIASCIEYVP